MHFLRILTTLDLSKAVLIIEAVQTAPDYETYSKY